MHFTELRKYINDKERKTHKLEERFVRNYKNINMKIRKYKNKYFLHAE